MRRLTTFICLTVAVLLGSTAEEWSQVYADPQKKTDSPTVIPSIEKLIKEKVISLEPGEIFYGGIFSRVEL